jgi:hypothetical protein
VRRVRGVGDALTAAAGRRESTVEVDRGRPGVSIQSLNPDVLMMGARDCLGIDDRGESVHCQSRRRVCKPSGVRCESVSGFKMDVLSVHRKGDSARDEKLKVCISCSGFGHNSDGRLSEASADASANV